MPFAEHPLRRALVSEMHLRSFVPVTPPARIVQIVRLIDDQDRANELGHLKALADGETDLQPEDRHAVVRCGEGQAYIWERHTEATTITAMVEGDQSHQLDEMTQRICNWPGEIVRATKIIVEPTEEAAQKHLPDMQFLQEDLVTCHVVGRARIWSDFRIRDDGFGRLVIAAPDMLPEALGRLVQQLQELGNYRNMALLGLPPVRLAMPKLDQLERQLSDYSSQLETSAGGDDDQLLIDLSGLSADLARIRTEHSFRLSATQAYARIASDRLGSLAVKSIDGFQSLDDFTERRLVPAVRTCATFAERLRRLSDRTGDVISLLNTRIDGRIRTQNLELLQSMEKSISLQFRLQRLVEGLSIIAVTYYAVGLLSYLVKGGAAAQRGDWPDAISGLVVLPIMGLIYLFIKRRTKQLLPGRDQ